MNMRDRVSVLEGRTATTRPASDKVMQTFRMPRVLVGFLKAEGARNGRDLTAQVLRILEGFRSHFGLPEAAAALLEADRRRLGMERYEYLLHVLYSRTLGVSEKGAGFDAPDPHHRRSISGAQQGDPEAVVRESAELP
jgi:hypothetical protein